MGPAPVPRRPASRIDRAPPATTAPYAGPATATKPGPRPAGDRGAGELQPAQRPAGPPRVARCRRPRSRASRTWPLRCRDHAGERSPRWGYDNDDQRTKATFPGGTTLSTAWDNDGRPHTVTGGSGGTTLFGDTHAYTRLSREGALCGGVWWVGAGVGVLCS